MLQPELVTRWGYPVETHTVRTGDGYLLDVHRIPGPQLSSDKPETTRTKERERPPVLLLHGFGATSECMVLRQNNTLGTVKGRSGCWGVTAVLVLPCLCLVRSLDAGGRQFRRLVGQLPGKFLWPKTCDAPPHGSPVLGFQVRNRREVRHGDFVTAPVNKTLENYNKHSWHENGVHDVAAMVDYVLKTTQQSSTMVVGHSMGGTAVLVMLTDRPEYNAKVKASFLLTPAVYFHNVRGGFASIRQNMPWGYVSRQATILVYCLRCIALVWKLKNNRVASRSTPSPRCGSRTF